MAGDVEGSPGGCCAHGGFVSQLRNLEFRQSHLLKEVAKKSTQSLPHGRYLYYPVKNIYSLPLRACETQHVPRLFAIQTSLKRQSLTKLDMRHREMPWKASLKTEEGSMTLALHPSRNKTKILLYNTVRIAIIGIRVGSDWNLKKTSTTG